MLIHLLRSKGMVLSDLMPLPNGYVRTKHLKGHCHTFAWNSRVKNALKSMEIKTNT